MSADHVNHESSAAPVPAVSSASAFASGRRRAIHAIVAIAVALLALSLFAEAGLRFNRMRARQQTAQLTIPDPCKSLIFLTMGDSMTWGLGADHATQSYPARFPEHFEEHYRLLDAKTVNLGVPGTNTSEGINMLRAFLDVHPDPGIDYALIMYGVNNRWNLHEATFWEWDERARDANYGEYLNSKLQLDKVFKIAAQNRSEAVREVTRTQGGAFRRALDEHGWDMFFNSFEDELLSRWIERDLGTLIEILKGIGAQPILLTYHFDRFGHLNDIIRRAADAASVPIVDVEQPMTYYAERRFFDKDFFHLNQDGYDELAARVADGLGTDEWRDAFWERWKTKSEKCQASK
ncbi:MAG: SGNH/GDSL hydrolase family protein [Deltaproteobacteria bacterium]|nr:SGNH/GDSL hydrolase family protein [Deltaproteobacteria bacterium]